MTWGLLAQIIPASRGSFPLHASGFSIYACGLSMSAIELWWYGVSCDQVACNILHLISLLAGQNTPASAICPPFGWLESHFLLR